MGLKGAGYDCKAGGVDQNRRINHRGIALSPIADEPDRKGLSSGVGKLLKFSENMVYVYNLQERKIDDNLSNISPLSKIVVFKMKQVFTLLDGIDYEHVGRIQFDGGYATPWKLKKVKNYLTSAII